MLFPLGELLLFSVVLFAWTERLKCRCRIYLLFFAWLCGKILGSYFSPPGVWHWDWARLAVIFFFALWAWQKAQRHTIPLLITFIALLVQDLFLLNEPGVLPGDQLFFGFATLLIACLVSHTYWETMSALSWALLLNQLCILFLYRGVVSYAKMPEPFSWHLWASTCAAGALVRFVAIKRKEKAQEKEQSATPQPAK